ncbi:MAG: acyltransferase [Leeuwenhoekiella sp.]
MKGKQQLDSLILLRVIAVIMVCFCHYGNALSEGHRFAGLFRIFSDYGNYGVHVFFVISGFVIPLSFARGNYKLYHYPRFLYKRFLRLHPPYLAALALTLIISFASYQVRNLPFPEDALSILKSTLYLHLPSSNPVFWTLAIEAQYYLFIGLFYIALVKYPRKSIFIFIPVLLVLSQLSFVHIEFLNFLIFFLMGTIGFLIYNNMGNRILNSYTLAGLIIFMVIFYDIEESIAACSTLLFILLYRKPIPKYLKFPGMISYSIYLIHFPLGIKFINLIKHKIPLSYSWVLFSVTMILVFAASYLFYRVFELHSEKLSKKIKYISNTTEKSRIVKLNLLGQDKVRI